MWIREWKCICPEDTLKGFLEYLEKTGVKDTQSLNGCCGYTILNREITDGFEVTLLTYWHSKEQMKEYAGKNMYRAVLYPEDHVYKIISDTDVKIYEIIASRLPS